MSDNEKSGGSTNDVTVARHDEVANDERPRGGFYYNTTTQVVMLGFVCFMGPVSEHSIIGEWCSELVDLMYVTLCRVCSTR